MIPIRVAIITLLLSINIMANSTKDEIAHLLNFVSTTDCKYIRNGTEHTGVEAKEHISKKYDYYREKIKTTEDFIRYSATKSELSGKRYQVLCPNKKIQYSNIWLLDELKHYRDKK
ncbi:hypothetical protein MNB_SV-6-1453 [hydrothermal vent metagenome]|uniref:DUF5329 domain-containing protein n=1 Tax=hydrothermal vent metagenome TaxID=652676 RepID=A0A1W1CGT6_9ZZZZ